jgi:pyruvate/2-oxoacid:ferredoxin oxidoreductase beta subunit
VLRSGDANGWRQETRNLAADFKTAFGTDAPAVTGIALGSDTDQTREKVVAHFGDVTLQPAAPRGSTGAP